MTAPEDKTPEQVLTELHDAGELETFVREAITEGVRLDAEKLMTGRQDRDSAERLLLEFQFHGATPFINSALFSWLYLAFDEILDGKDANEALGLKRRRGQSKNVSALYAPAVALFVYLWETETVRSNVTDTVLRQMAVRAATKFFLRGERTITNALRAATELNTSLERRVMWAVVHEHRPGN